MIGAVQSRDDAMQRLLARFSIAGALSTLLLAGCASTPGDAPPFSRAPAAPTGYATVYVYRVHAPPRLRTPDVVIAGTKVSEPPELTYTWLHVRAGDPSIAVHWSWDTGWPDVQIPMRLEAGNSYYFKISGSFDTPNATTHILGSSIRQVPASDAQAELAVCCKYVAPLLQRLPQS